MHAPGDIDVGTGEPLVLLHPAGCAPLVWRDAMPLLAAEHRAIALAALGHHGGRRCERRPCRIQALVDDTERALDALGVERAHVAGNSMGGWIALELARRGRARSVCAFSPAGMWGSSENRSVAMKLRALFALTRVGRPVVPLLAKYPPLRKLVLRDTAEHGERVPAQVLIDLVDAMNGCEILEDLLGGSDTFQVLEPNCPVDVVWSDRDRILPPEPFANNARRLVPGARHFMLTDVGHTPMIESPALVARTILDTIARAARKPH